MKIRTALKPLLLGAALLLCPLPAAAADAPPPVETWRYKVDIRSTHDYKSVQLGADMYTNAAPDLVNLRVQDSQGNQAPYFLYNAETETKTRALSFEGHRLERLERDGDTLIDFGFDRPENTDVYGNVLRLYIGDNGFAKQMTVLVSSDRLSWTEIGRGLIYRVDAGEKLEIDLGEPRKDEYYRLRIPANAEGVDVSSIELLYSAETSRRQSFEAVLSPRYTVEEGERESRLLVPAQALRGLRLTRLTLRTNSSFSRFVKTPLAGDVLYNLSFQDCQLTKTRLELPGRVYTGEGDFVIEIQNEDDLPIQVDGVELTYACDRVVFKAEPDKDYYLVLDSAADTAPVYDIASYAGHILNGELEPCAYSFADRRAREPEQQESGAADAWIFNIALAAASLALIALILRATLRKKDS